jgi:proline utilization trans-activator
MGMHLNIPESLLSDRAAREHRVRIWWTAYVFDRTWASKLGHPVSVHDDDIDVDLPRSDGLEGHEDFGDYEYILRTIELARLTGSIIPSIYGRRKQQKPFSSRVQQALSDLTSWVESLPSQLQLHRGEGETSSPSNVIYLHLTFNQCVIMATRPILLHVFSSDSNTASIPISEGARRISQTCIQCARHSFRLLSEAWLQGSFAIFDYFKTQYLFSAAIILVISALSDKNNDIHDADDFDTSIQILSQLAQSGNFGAKEFCLHIDAMKTTIEESALNMREPLTIIPISTPMSGTTQQAIFPYTATSMTTSMALADSSLRQFLIQPERNFLSANMTGLDEIQPNLWSDLWVGDWMNS